MGLQFLSKCFGSKTENISTDPKKKGILLGVHGRVYEIKFFIISYGAIVVPHYSVVQNSTRSCFAGVLYVSNIRLFKGSPKKYQH